MKKTLIAAAMALGLALMAGAQKGPIVDQILVSSKTQEDLAMKDVATGDSDLFDWGVDGAAFKSLPDADRAKLDVYSTTGGNQWSLYVNPYPNAAPYTVDTKDGDRAFNPFAIREVRFALNLLIDRKHIVDEIMAGAGLPMFTCVPPGQPNYSRFELVAKRMGLTATGNEQKALADIDAALRKAAAADPKLAKKGQWWTYGRDPVSVKFLIRVDDPTGRLPEGRYIADQIEKAGIKVERLEYDRAKCRALWDKSDPKDYGWSLYTEGWGNNVTTAFWESTVAQMYAPWQGFMPGGGTEGFWKYRDKELDDLTQAAYNGRVKDEAEYYGDLLKATDLGLKEAVRVWLVAQTVFYPTNKDRFDGRMIWGLGDGIDNWSLYTADVKPIGGRRSLKLVEFSAKGELFMSSWDPLGPDGFSDTYSAVYTRVLSDMETAPNPITGVYMPMRASWTAPVVKFDGFDADGQLKGRIPVPARAVLWNARDQKWESGIVYADFKHDGSTYDYQKADKPMAAASATFAFKYGRWHDGRAVDINDYRYALAIPYDISVQKSGDDKVYEPSYASATNPNLVRAKGYVFGKDGTITVYGDANYPADPSGGGLAQLLCPSLQVEASNYGVILPWPVLEAIKGIVAEGSASKTAYSYNSDESFTEVDVLSAKCVADLKAKLQEYQAAKRVPAALVGYITADQAVAAYASTLKFLGAHGHLYISNGGFYLDSYDAKNNTAVLKANRDPSYPFAQGYFAKSLAASYARIDNVALPAYRKGAELAVGVSLSEVAFPSDQAAPAKRGKLKVTLAAAAGDKVYLGARRKDGLFQATIPAKDLAALPTGSYILVIEAALGDEAGPVETRNLVVFN
jgi:peptide/nickel transport system substrate-binding protein